MNNPIPVELDPSIAKTVVHIYGTMRVRVELDRPMLDREAIKAALADTDLYRQLARGEYAEEVTAFGVDQEDDNGEYVSELPYDADAYQVHSTVEQGRYIVLSTSHLSKADLSLLVSMEGRDTPFMVAGYKEGFVLSLRPRMDEKDLDAKVAEILEWGLSDSFIVLWKGLSARGYGLLQFDQDGSEHPEFVTPEW